MNVVAEKDIDPIFVSIRTARRITGLGMTTIYDLLAIGAIDSVKVGTRRLLKYESLKKIGIPVPAQEAA